MPDYTEYVSFEDTYVQTEVELASDNPDCFMSVTIDGYPADENEEGTVIAAVYITKRGDLVTDWHHNGYRGNETVKELIENAKAMLLREYGGSKFSKKES